MPKFCNWNKIENLQPFLGAIQIIRDTLSGSGKVSNKTFFDVLKSNFKLLQVTSHENRLQKTIYF